MVLRILSLFVLLHCTGIVAQTPLPPKNEKNDAPKEQIDPYAPEHQDQVYKDYIRTVQFRLRSTQNGYPIVRLFSQDQLLLSFDDMRGDEVDYAYEIVQCNADWSRSIQNPLDYIDGFADGEIDDLNFAKDTHHDYTTYFLFFPNTFTNVSQSGNYLLVVYEEDSPEEIVMTKRFMVYEEQASVAGGIVRPNISRYIRSHQNLRFAVNYGGLYVNNPRRDLRISIMQNGRWDNAITGLEPMFLGNDELLFNSHDQTLFKAGREFRFFDSRDLRIEDEKMIRILKDEEGYHIQLETDLLNAEETKNFKRDLNGRFHIDRFQKIFKTADEEYVDVHFSLQMDEALQGGEIFIFGALSEWKAQEAFKMYYNPARNAYEANVLLKQGLYNYQYVVVWENEDGIDDESLEDHYWNNLNDYLVLVYFRDFNGAYDRLVAVQLLNTLW